MLSLAGVVLVLAAVSMSIAGRLREFPGFALGAVLVLGVFNLVGARILIAPVARYLERQGDLEAARRRIVRLPILSADLAFFRVCQLVAQ